jgi:hypothetical protein
MNPRRLAVACLCLASLLACLTSPGRAAGEYPMTLTFDASVSNGTTTVTSKVTIHVDRLMEESRRKRVMDALTYSGYPNFLNTLRTLPPVGSIAIQARKVDVRYAHEEQAEAGRRLVLVADRPLFFLSADSTKDRVGYELTMVELRFDAQGKASGTMTGAARVKPSPNGLVLDNFAETPVKLAAGAPGQ